MFKPLRKSDYTTAACQWDPAINKDTMTEQELREYLTTRDKNPACFRDKLKVKDGEKLTVFSIGVIPPEEMVRIIDDCKPGMDGMRMEELCWRAFLHSLRDIEGWGEEVRKKKVNGIEYVSPEWIKENFIRGYKAVAIDIGYQAWWWNNIREDEIKN